MSEPIRLELAPIEVRVLLRGLRLAIAVSPPSKRERQERVRIMLEKALRALDDKAVSDG